MAKTTSANGKPDDEKATCGIIMPISGNENYSKEHWSDVKCILEEAITDAGFLPRLVSDANDVGIIHNRIVQNIYNNPLVVCDVSSKNPNVMFELGLRLAFDKPTIIVKDDITTYTFDTGVIEHIAYPRDLRYGLINDFKASLKIKLKATFEASRDSNYSTFLKHFVQYKTTLKQEEISGQDYIQKQLEAIRSELQVLRSQEESDLFDEAPMNINTLAIVHNEIISLLNKKQFSLRNYENNKGAILLNVVKVLSSKYPQIVWRPLAVQKIIEPIIQDHVTLERLKQKND